MRIVKLNDEVLVAEGPVVQITHSDITDLKGQALSNPRLRIRICAHADTSDRLHEMFIVHARGTYVRPHKHLGKSESVHIIEGEVDVVFFSEDGRVTEVAKLGDIRSGRSFFCRVGEAIYHTLLITSEFLVFHEVTNGPFQREDTVFPVWAPEACDTAGCLAFQDRVVKEAAAAS